MSQKKIYTYIPPPPTPPTLPCPSEEDVCMIRSAYLETCVVHWIDHTVRLADGVLN